jgi:hypothetical protein
MLLISLPLLSILYVVIVDDAALSRQHQVQRSSTCLAALSAIDFASDSPSCRQLITHIPIH